MTGRKKVLHSLLRVARRFAANRKGATAVEFALIAGPFFMIIFAIIEISLMFFAQQALETGTQDTARMIMTGEAKGLSPSQFQTALCAKLATFFNCSGIRIAAQSFDSFGAITPFNPLDGNGNFVLNFPYSTGNSGTATGTGSNNIMLVQVSYKWPLFVTKLGYQMANADSSHRLLTTAVAFRNEPY